MIVVLIILSTFTFSSGLFPSEIVELADESTRGVINKYISNIPDIKDQFIIDERLSRAISHFFKGKLSAFPLYKISLKIDRNPVKIPWTIEAQSEKEKAQLRDRVNNQFYHPSREPNKHVQKKYQFEQRFTINNEDIDTTEPSKRRPTIEDKNERHQLSKAHNNTIKNKDSAKLSKSPVKINQQKTAKKNVKTSNKTKRVKNPNKGRGDAKKDIATANKTITNSSEKYVETKETSKDIDHKQTNDADSTDVPSTPPTKLAKTEETINNITEKSSRASELFEEVKSEESDTTILPYTT